MTITTPRGSYVSRVEQTGKGPRIVGETIIEGASNKRVLIADRELYADETQEQLLEAGEPGAAFLVASGAGRPIDAAFTLKLGLVSDADGHVSQRVAHAKERAAGGDKQRKAPARKKGAPKAK